MKNIWDNIVSKSGKMRNSKFYLYLAFCLTLFCGYLLNPFISRTVEHFTQKLFSTKQLSYEVTSISSYKKYKLAKVAKMEGLNPFSLNLDDPILTDYYLIKVRLRNEGDVIKDTLNFNVSFNKPRTKIIDIKYNIISPVNKSLKLIHSLPSLLTWKLPENMDSKYIVWNQDSLDTVAGFNVYRSIQKNVGYGRVNERLLLQQKFQIPIESLNNLSTFYYTVTAVGINGLESDFHNTPMKFPNILAFYPFFEDVSWITPSAVLDYKADGSYKYPFHSLSEAITSTSKSTIFLVDKIRKDIVNSQNISSDVTTFYKDDLRFLNGKAEVKLLNGIDEHANIQIFFLCKVMPGEEIDLSLNLEGAPDVRFKRLVEKSLHNVRMKNNSAIINNPKALLTPSVVKAYLGQNTIYLVWEKPQSLTYKGVRIFRSIKREIADKTNLGEELYDGPGYTNTLCYKYTSGSRDSLVENELKQKNNEIYRPLVYGSLPPPRKGENPPPGSPTGLGASYTMEVKVDDSFYFADKEISSDMVYTYTVYAYGDNGLYSYPILINASLSDWVEGSDCYPLPDNEKE